MNTVNQKTTLGEIFHPIARELVLVEMELSNQIKSFTSDSSISEIVKYFFKKSGKRLRPALTLFSAKIAADNNKKLLPVDESKLIRFAAAVELIHSASLIHDDIIDDDSHRRKQLCLNTQFGNQIAVLAGDILYARAFSILTGKSDGKIPAIISQCVEKMCCGEISELRKPAVSYGEYLKIIEDKTAGFMSVCCECGAMLNGTEQKVSRALADYGFNLGMAYQIVDDYIDKDSIADANAGLRQAEEFASKSKQSIKILPDSVYKEKLSDLVDYILNLSLRVPT